MATADEVTIVLQAKADTFLRNIKSAEQTFVGSLDRIENEADQAGSALATVGTRGTKAFTAAATQAPGAATAIGGARSGSFRLALTS